MNDTDSALTTKLELSEIQNANITISIPGDLVLKKFNTVMRAMLAAHQPEDIINYLDIFIDTDVGRLLATAYIKEVTGETLGREFFSRDAKMVISQLSDSQIVELFRELVCKPEQGDLFPELQEALEYASNRHLSEDKLNYLICNFGMDEILNELISTEGLEEVVRTLGNCM